MQKFDRSKLIRNVSKKEKLVPFLEKAWATFDEPFSFDYHPKKGDFGWHPSGMCTPPVSALYAHAVDAYVPGVAYDFDGELSEPAAMRPNTRKAFMVGHFWHQTLQYIMQAKLGFCGPEDVERRGMRSWGFPASFLCDINDSSKSEQTPRPFHYATGSGDIAPCVTPNWTGVVDIKTMKLDHFKLTGLPQDTYGDDFSTADKYECQINIYMDFFDLDSGIILCVCKDTGDFKEFMFERNQELIDSIYAKWKFVSKLLDANRLPHPSDDDLFPLYLTGPVAQ